MTMEMYKVFYHVAEKGSFTAAAKTLFVSQPAVTKSVKGLEEDLGVKLFIRKGQGIELTDEGHALYSYVQTAFLQLEQGERIVRQMKDKDTGMIRIGISNTLCKYYFIPHLEKFHDAYPNLKIEIVNRTSPETLELLENGAIDCAIISEVPSVSGLAYHELMEIQDTFAAKEPPPEKPMPLERFKDHPLILMEKKNATRRYVEDWFLEHQIPIQADIEISSMEFLIDFAKIGLGVSAVIKEFIEGELARGELYEWQAEPELPKRSIGLLYPQKGNSIACLTFIDFMKLAKK